MNKQAAIVIYDESSQASTVDILLWELVWICDMQNIDLEIFVP